MDLLDNLAISTAPRHLELDAPKYASSYGRRTEAVFKNNAPPAPMVYAPDAGLVLYERVITNREEHQLLDKLCKPKWYRPPVSKSEDRAASHAAASNSKARASSAQRKSGRGEEGEPVAEGGNSSGPRSRGPSPGGDVQGSVHCGSQRTPLYSTDNTLSDYFKKERSSVTATIVFTWGNRYKLNSMCTAKATGAAGASESSTAAFKSHTPTHHKPPLRL